MACVYLEYTKNMFTGYPDYFMMGIFVAISFASVSIYDVFINTTNILQVNIFSIFSFFVSAILNTSRIIQILIAGFLIRTVFTGIKLAQKNIRNASWVMAKFRY